MNVTSLLIATGDSELVVVLRPNGLIEEILDGGEQRREPHRRRASVSCQRCGHRAKRLPNDHGRGSYGDVNAVGPAGSQDRRPTRH